MEERNFYQQQTAWLNRHKHNPLYYIGYPLVLLYRLIAWLNWKTVQTFSIELSLDAIGAAIMATITAAWLALVGICGYIAARGLVFVIPMLWTIFFGGVGHMDVGSHHAPTAAPTAFGTHTRDTWLDNIQYLSPLEAQKLLHETNVTNVVVIDESTGRVQIAKNLKTNFTSHAWVLQQATPFAITGITPGPGTSCTITINSNTITLNQRQAFILQEDPRVAYAVGSDGSVYAANVGTDAIVPITQSIPDPHLSPNPNMTLPQ